jgi:2-oxoacid:acceptor oxidoreductase gamma subunit (pyruvate/2-ketoisovalerate family)
MNEIKFCGRGGQGVVTASQMLGLAFFNAGMYPQCYSLFGGERRGAPVVSFLRVDVERILLKCEIKNPDELLYFDQGLIDKDEIQAIMKPGGRILINTSLPASRFEELSGFTLGLVDANSVAEGLGLGHMINTSMVGAYSRLTGFAQMDHLIRAVEEMVPAKREANVKALLEGYDALKVFHRGRQDGTS